MVRVTQPWYRHAILYEIYLHSFYDSNGDGLGDLRGVIEKLDYLAGASDSLGVDALWITPFYPSPMADSGYDITDYFTIDPTSGTLDDLKELITESHRRGVKVLIDFIPNHTSDEHPWFQDARSSLTALHRDWYIWHEPKADGSPPNNWLSVFGGSAWQLDAQTNQYYLHSFLAKQPDLNWRNPKVRDEIKKALTYWLEVGVDGFRVDAIDWLAKDELLRDDVPDMAYDLKKDPDPYDSLKHIHSRDDKVIYTYLREITLLVAEYPERFVIVEDSPNPHHEAAFYREFYNEIDRSVGAPFNFGAIMADWDAGFFKGFVDRFQSSLEGESVPVYCFGNHDHPRLASRIGSEAAKTAAVMIMTLPGIATIYSGDELGMLDGHVGLSRVRDQWTRNEPTAGLGRDPQRTPIPWTEDSQAGFTTGTPWLPVASGYKTLNVAVQDNDPASFLNLYRRLIRFRKTSSALLTGSYRSLDLHPEVFAYTRKADNQKLTILLNFSDKPITLRKEITGLQAVISTQTDSPLPTVLNCTLTLQPHEGLILTAG